MSVVLLLSIILATQLPPYTFGKSSAASSRVAEVPAGEITIEAVANVDGSKIRRNSVAGNDDDDFLINKLSREYVTSNLLHSTATSCSK